MKIQRKKTLPSYKLIIAFVKNIFYILSIPVQTFFLHLFYTCINNQLSKRYFPIYLIVRFGISVRCGIYSYPCFIKGNGSFWSYSLSGCIGLGHFQSDFRGGSFLPNFGESFRPTSFYTVLKGNKKIFWLVLFILCSFIDNKKFSWLPRLIYAVFIDNKSFSGLTYFLARFTDLFYLEILKHIYLSIYLGARRDCQSVMMCVCVFQFS